MPRTNRSRTGQAGTSPHRRRTASKARLADLRHAAIEQAEALHSDTDWLRLLRYAEHFCEYGGTNTLLILRERPHATRLATYEQWKRDGNPVQRGERGITLRDPSTPGHTLRVFDITQTGQPPAPGPLRHLRPARHTPSALQAALNSIAMRKGFDVLNDSAGTAGRTAFAERSIHLHAALAGEPACYALAHELAHVLLHSTAQLDQANGACDGTLLVEAESVAYIVCRNAGLDVAPFTFPDPPIWAGTDLRANPGETILSTIDRITATARALIAQAAAINPPPPQPAQPAVQKSRPETNAVQSVRPAEFQRDPRLVEIHERAERFFTEQLPGSWVPGYLAARGMAAALDADAPWGIGYAPATWTALVDHLHAHGCTDDEIINSGLGTRSRTGRLIDRFRDRAIVPVRALDSTTIAFIGRTNPEAAPSDGHPIPKYLNSPQTPLFIKGAVLFGLDTAQSRLSNGAIPVLVEGTLDAIAIHIADTDQRYAPIAPSGTALTREQVVALSQTVNLADRGVLVAFDGDPAGQHAATRAHKLLSEHTNRLHHAQLTAGTDPALLLETHGPQAVLDGLVNIRPLAATVLTEHLETTRDLTRWDRCERAAILIARLTPTSETAVLADANVPDPDSHPGNAAALTAEAAARLLPAATNHLVATAAEAIDVPINRVMYDVIEAATDRAQQQARMEKNSSALHPARTGTRDAGPDPPTITATPHTAERSRTSTEAPPQHPRRP